MKRGRKVGIALGLQSAISYLSPTTWRARASGRPTHKPAHYTVKKFWSGFKQVNWRRYGFEFVSIFVAVVSAFALTNWNDNRREGLAELKILSEIRNGLEKDLEDIALNMTGHRQGFAALDFWRKIIRDDSVDVDSLAFHYLALTRDFVSIQNVSGYETLKSRGLELVRNDSLRYKIISLYEYDYSTLRKLEEDYGELQFHENYFPVINQYLAPHLRFDPTGRLVGIDRPLALSAVDRSLLLSLFWRITTNRRWLLYYYKEVKQKILELQSDIDRELAR